MKKVKLLFDNRFTYMSDGEQIFDGCVVAAMQAIQLWDSLMLSYKFTHNGINYFISIGANGGYFKTDGQIYSTHLHIQKGDDCYLAGCLCSWKKSDFPKDVERFIGDVEKYTNEGIDFEEKFQAALKNYPWQTSRANLRERF